MAIDLVSTPEQRVEKFYGLRSFRGLADLLEVSPQYLKYVLYNPRLRAYTEFAIPKRSLGAFRIISSPHPELKIIQRKLKQVLDYVYLPKVSTHGFVKGRSIVSNASYHRKKRKLRFVLNIDLVDFFPSIHFGRVRGLFESRPYGFPRTVAEWLARICCSRLGLPQGAPTSPIISNMLCNKLDSQLRILAKNHRCYYTRYADDITFSTTLTQFPVTLASRIGDQVVLGEGLDSLIVSNGFKVNLEKIHFQEAPRRQEITGLTVNQFPNVRRKLIRQIRAMLYDWAKIGYEAAESRHRETFSRKHRFPDKPPISFRQVLRGKIEFLGSVRGKQDPLYRRYMAKLKILDPLIRYEVTEEMAISPAKIFLSYASEDYETVLEIYGRLKALGYEPWMDKKDIVGGENWPNAINNAIDTSDFFVLMLSPRSVGKRGALQKEIRRALVKFEGKLISDIYVIPFRLEACEPPSQFKEFQRIDYFESDGFGKLTKAIAEGMQRARDLG